MTDNRTVPRFIHPPLPSRRLLLGTVPLLLGMDRIAGGAQTPGLHRVLVSTDIGGTDPDDFQSMVHLLLYADDIDLVGIVSSPYGPGRREHILEVIDRYEKDYPNLRTWSSRYPTPDALRAITTQGATDNPGPRGVSQSTEGSNWIVRCAREPDPRPLYVLVWGGIEDLAQALHDAPDILPKLRLYFIGGPNKMWSVNAYNYIETRHPKLWFIESNATYRGWFVGGDQSGDLGNRSFVAAHIQGRGALGDYFATQLKGVIKMGDTPSLAYILHGNPEEPTGPSWGGGYVRIWDHRKKVFHGFTTEADIAEVFGVVEFVLPLPRGMSDSKSTRMIFDNRIPATAENDGRALRFRFSPRDAKVWNYAVESESEELHGKQGKFTATPPSHKKTSTPSKVHPHWWIDDPNPSAAEGIHPGARSVNRWRAEFLRDFQERMNRCRQPQVHRP